MTEKLKKQIRTKTGKNKEPQAAETKNQKLRC